VTPRIIRSVAARRDIVDIAEYIGRHNPFAAERFLAAVAKGFADLAAMPLMGPVREFPDPAAAGLRRWFVPGFRNHIIFYRPLSDGVEIVRVEHAARDMDSLFQE